MLSQVAAGALLLFLTTLVHAFCTSIAMRCFGPRHDSSWRLATKTGRTISIASLAVGMYLAAVVEAGIWAGAYVATSAIENFEEAIYFSIVTFTTLGYGDISLAPRWRLLSSLEGVNGIILFGWSTALIVALVHKVFVRKDVEVEGVEPSRM